MKCFYLNGRLIFFVIILFIFSLPSRSQNWAFPGSTWYYGTSSAWTAGYQRISYVSDTVILGVNAKKLTNYYEGNGAFGYYSGYDDSYYTYSQSGVTYLYNDQITARFDTLFDVNAQVGDSWRMPLSSSDCLDTLNFIKVLNLGTTNINGQSLKWLYVHYNPFGYSGGQGLYDTIIERIGFVGYGFFHQTYCSVAEEQIYSFRCYSDNTFGSFSKYSGSCDYFYTDVSENKPGPEFSVFPNPGSGKVTMHFDRPTSEETVLNVFDPQGKLIRTQNIFPNRTDVIIDTETLAKGLYILRLEKENGTSNVKLVIE